MSRICILSIRHGGMGMEGEHDRLLRLYGEMGDEHLEDLAKDFDDLTDDARAALLHELRKRGLAVQPPAEVSDDEARPVHEEGFGVGIPGILPAGEAAMEQGA